MAVNTPLIQQLIEQVQQIAENARALMNYDENQRKSKIPGLAKWNGFDEDGRATVKIKKEIFLVDFISNTIPPIGTEVYVDEEFKASYINVKPKEPEKKIEIEKPPKPKFLKRRKKILDPIFLEVEDIPSGATWIVYPEILNPLDVKTEAEVQTNPAGYDYNLFLTLGAALVLGGGVLIGLMFGGIDEKLEFFNVRVQDLPDPSEHDNIPDGLSGEDFAKFVMFQGTLDSAQVGTPLWMPLDGLYAGIGGIFDDSVASILINNKGGYGLHFTEIIAFNPEGVDVSISAVLYMFSVAELLTGSKIQASIIRANAVYPPKNIHINVHGWPALPNKPIDPDDDSTLPVGAFIRFSVPDDIEEWDLLSGSGPLDPTVDKRQNFVYDLVPIHHLHDYLDDVDELDHTKFASYENNNLFLHYVIITYAPWTGLGNDLRINYYNLNLKLSLVVDELLTSSIEVTYKLAPAAFNLPYHFRVLGDIVTESPNFPLQAGSRNQFTREVTFRIQGNQSPLTVGNGTSDVINLTAVQGNNALTGFINVQTFDDPYIEINSNDPENPVLAYHPSRAPIFEHGTPIPGFAINSRTGEYIFDQNNSNYHPLEIGETITRTQIVYISSNSSEEGGENNSLSVTFNISIVGAGSLYQTTTIDEPIASVFPYETVGTPPTHEYDPNPYVEDISLQSSSNDSPPQIQEFDEVTVFIPFPDVTDDGSAFSWQGQEPTLSFQSIDAPTIVLRTGKSGINTTEYYIEPFAGTVSEEDFDFELIEPTGPLPSESGISVKFKPKNKSYHFLGKNEELFITYKINGSYNEAPYVGNFEDLNELQRKRVRASAIYNAHSEDWRYNIYNPIEEEIYNGYLFPTDDVAAQRDLVQPELNLARTTQTISANYLHEFNLKGYEPDEDFEGINEESIFFTNKLGFDFYTESGEVLEDIYFYEKSLPPLQRQALSATEVSAIVVSDSTLPKNRYFDISKMMPSGFERDSGDVSKWNMYISSKHVRGYLIYGYLPIG